MERKNNRRRSKRYPVRWKATVVFENPHDRPVLHTETQDLSPDGAAIYSEYPDLTGVAITLLLMPPTRGADEPAKMVKVRARVVLTIQTPNSPPYRHGLSFIRTPDDGLEVIPESPHGAAGEAGPHAEGGPRAPRLPAAVSRLAQLRQLAQAKLAEAKRAVSPEEPDLRVSEALKRIHEYLKDFAAQLDILKPVYPLNGYAIAGVPEFDELAWKESRIHFNTRELGRANRLWTAVSLHYCLSGSKQVRVTRDYPANERLQHVLSENRIEFTTRDERSDRGSVVRTTFDFPCEVRASLAFAADFKAGKLILRMRNVERFGSIEHVLAPDAVNEASLDELIRYIMGETAELKLLPAGGDARPVSG